MRTMSIRILLELRLKPLPVRFCDKKLLLCLPLCDWEISKFEAFYKDDSRYILNLKDPPRTSFGVLIAKNFNFLTRAHLLSWTVPLSSPKLGVFDSTRVQLAYFICWIKGLWILAVLSVAQTNFVQFFLFDRYVSIKWLGRRFKGTLFWLFSLTFCANRSLAIYSFDFLADFSGSGSSMMTKFYWILSNFVDFFIFISPKKFLFFKVKKNILKTIEIIIGEERVGRTLSESVCCCCSKRHLWSLWNVQRRREEVANGVDEATLCRGRQRLHAFGT